jgi:hypothetical protein
MASAARKLPIYPAVLGFILAVTFPKPQPRNNLALLSSAQIPQA